MTTIKRPVVLLGDDDLEFCRLVEHLLQKFGIEVVSVLEPKDLLQELKKKAFDLCLIDLNMGTQGIGAQVSRAIRKVLGPEIPIIMVSSHHRPDQLKEAVMAGVNDYLHKPLDRRLLALKLARFVSTPEMQEWLEDSNTSKKSSIPAHLKVQFDVTKVDETSVQVVAPYLVSEGTQLVTHGDLWKYVMGNESAGAMLTVSNILAGGHHELIVDEGRVDLKRALRYWLVRQEVEHSLDKS
jgi:CheY-like chemotaxis protein